MLSGLANARLGESVLRSGVLTPKTSSGASSSSTSLSIKPEYLFEISVGLCVCLSGVTALRKQSLHRFRLHIMSSCVAALRTWQSQSGQ